MLMKSITVFSIMVFASTLGFAQDRPDRDIGWHFSEVRAEARAEANEPANAEVREREPAGKRTFDESTGGGGAGGGGGGIGPIGLVRLVQLRMRVHMLNERIENFSNAVKTATNAKDRADLFRALDVLTKDRGVAISEIEKIVGP